jgi:hypothetical protein
VGGSCEYGDEPSGSGATELVSSVLQMASTHRLRFLLILIAKFRR